MGLITKISNRVGWIVSLLKNRGLLATMQSVRKEIWSSAEWKVLVLENGAEDKRQYSSESFMLGELTEQSDDLFRQIADIWPSEFPKLKDNALLHDLRRRAASGVWGFVLLEAGLVRGAVWLDTKESHLRTSAFRPASADRVVKNIFIDSSQQGRNLARIMLRQVLIEARRRHTRRVIALVYPYRIASVRTFLALGFEEAGVVRETCRLLRCRDVFAASRHGDNDHNQRREIS